MRKAVLLFLLTSLGLAQPKLPILIIDGVNKAALVAIAAKCRLAFQSGAETAATKPYNDCQWWWFSQPVVDYREWR